MKVEGKRRTRNAEEDEEEEGDLARDRTDTQHSRNRNGHKN